MICDKCNKDCKEVHTKTEYIDLRLSTKDRAKQKSLEGLWLCSSCWNKVIILNKLPSYEIYEENNEES